MLTARYDSTMQVVNTTDVSGFFTVIAETSRAQAAVMTLDPGSATGGPENAHAGSDQWLFVKRGSGTAIVEGDSYDLAPGTLVCIEPGERHEITNDGEEPLETINIYAPPEY